MLEGIMAKVLSVQLQLATGRLWSFEHCISGSESAFVCATVGIWLVLGRRKKEC